MEKIERFKIIGIETKTTNEGRKSATDLANIWERFYTENIPDKIPNKKSDKIYAIYTDYESEYRGKYTSIIGLKVSTLEEIPNGLIGRGFNGGKYQKFIAKGQMPNAVVEAWIEICEKDSELNRKYTADFEVYGRKSQNGESSEVDIYIATQ